MAKWLVRFGTGGKIFRKDITNGLPPEEEEEEDRTRRHQKISAALKGKPKRKAVVPDGHVDAKQFAELCKCTVDHVYVMKVRDSDFPRSVDVEGKGHVLIWTIEVAQRWAAGYLKRKGRRRR